MNTVRGIGEWAVPIALFYGLRAAMGAAAFQDWFGPYIRLGVMIWDRLPDWHHPVVLVIGAAFVLLLLSGWIRLARVIASAVVALFVVRSGFALAGEGSVPPPDVWLGATAVLALGWLLFSASFGDPRLWSWIRKWRGMQCLTVALIIYALESDLLHFLQIGGSLVCSRK